MDALELLRAQHTELLPLFDRLLEPPLAFEPHERARAFGQLAEGVDLHLRIEDRHLYPLLRELALESISFRLEEEHRSIHRVLDHLRQLEVSDLGFVPMLLVLRDQMTRHCRREEQRLFPALAASISPLLRAAVAQTMLETIAEIENEHWIGTTGTDHAW